MAGPFDLSGRVAIVTGGNGGIGLGIALGLAEAGAGIVVAARNEAKTASALKEIQARGVKAIGLKVDIARREDVARMVDETLKAFGRVDILVNNAAINIRGKAEEITPEVWEQVLRIDLTAVLYCSQAVFKPMKQQGGGKIINLGSMNAIFGNELVTPYAVSKAGVVELTKSLAIAWAPYNIQVNAILPGWITTDMTAGFKAFSPARYELVTRRIPTGRWGVPADVAGAAVFFSSHASDYVTGALLTVDGGYSVF